MRVAVRMLQELRAEAERLGPLSVEEYIALANEGKTPGRDFEFEGEPVFVQFFLTQAVEKVTENLVLGRVDFLPVGDGVARRMCSLAFRGEDIMEVPLPNKGEVRHFMREKP